MIDIEKKIIDSFKKLNFLEYKPYTNKKNKILFSVAINIQNLNYEEVAKIVIKITKNKKYLELPHPDYPEIITRARLSNSKQTANILFTDENDNNAWILCQTHDFANACITDSNIYLFSNNYRGFNPEKIINSLLDLLKKTKLLSYENSYFSGFLLGKSRPFHFFYDMLMNLVYIENTYGFEGMKFLFKNKNIFFDFSQLFKEKDFLEYFHNYDNEKIFLNLSFIRIYKSYQITKNNQEAMENLIIDNTSLNKFQILPNYNFVLWIGITGQKRSWLEQIDGYAMITNQLSKIYSNILLVIDGATSAIEPSDTIKNMISEDTIIYDAIVQKLNSNISVLNLIGEIYEKKLQIAMQADLFIVNSGTGGIIPIKFCKNCLTIVHSNTRFMNFKTEEERVVLLDKKYILPLKLNLDRDKIDYHIHWESIYNTIIDILNKTKGTKIKNIQVPSLELFIDKERKEPFRELDNIIKNEHESADILKTVALAFEKSGDLQTAIIIMQKAFELQPERLDIENKIKDYKSW